MIKFIKNYGIYIAEITLFISLFGFAYFLLIAF